ncbi:MAG: FkbM family methyltransferase [Eubacterium sp.]|nr:FkbM family methyltransferase [Eubacterium sp.]
MDKKKIILFGIGNNGKSIMDAYEKYDTFFEVTAIADNRSDFADYAGVKVISPDQIRGCEYDEVWISSIYYREIRKQLVEQMQIPSSRVRYVEYPVPFLEKAFFERYREELAGQRKCGSEELQQVMDYVSDNGVRMYCYPFYDEYMEQDAAVCYDEERGLYYGVCFGRRMYLARRYDTPQKAGLYFQYACMEQDERSPHRYISKHFSVEKGDVGIDIGAAEGIFALQVIDDVEHIYLIEADAEWCEALKATFGNERDKVTIIQGYVSDTDRDGNLTLDVLFGEQKIDFIKMDIEGAERKALYGAEQLVERCVPKLAVCTYHNENDESDIHAWMEAIGTYTVTNSPGYVVCQGAWELEHLEVVGFRRALLWGERKIR